MRVGAPAGKDVLMAPGAFLRRVEGEAAKLGHTIEWGTVGEVVARGRCLRCGEELTIAVSREGLGETRGGLLQVRCRSVGGSSAGRA